MGHTGNIQLLAAAAAIFAAAGVQAQTTVPYNSQMQTTYDPYNPQTERQAASNPPAAPTLMDMGWGTDVGNIGPFVTIPDKQFARVTAIRALMEVELSTKALEKSDRADVKNVARLMIDDYTRWGDGMKRAAAYLKIEIPAKLDAKRQAEVDRICALTGPEFDKAYLDEVVHLQDKAVTVTQYEASNAGVTGFRHWAGVMVPKLQDEVKLAKESLNGNMLYSRK